MERYFLKLLFLFTKYFITQNLQINYDFFQGFSVCLRANFNFWNLKCLFKSEENLNLQFDKYQSGDNISCYYLSLKCKNKKAAQIKKHKIMISFQIWLFRMGNLDIQKGYYYIWKVLSCFEYRPHNSNFVVFNFAKI